MARETWVQSQVESYQRLKKWYFMPPCLALSIIRYGSRVKWSNPGKGVAPSPTPWCSKAIEKGAFGSPSTMVANFTYLKSYKWNWPCSINLWQSFLLYLISIIVTLHYKETNQSSTINNNYYSKEKIRMDINVILLLSKNARNINGSLIDFNGMSTC